MMSIKGLAENGLRILRSASARKAHDDGKLACAVWELTLRCNLRCTHCGSSAGTPRENELSTKECFGLCEQLADLGCRDVALMGGEPFLREDFREVGRAVRQLGMNLSFVSNGMTMDKYIDDVTNLEPKVVGISLDGLRASHEAIRGKDTFDKALGAIDMLKGSGIQTTVITTVSKANYGDLPALKDLLLAKKVNWQIQIAMPFGNFKRELTLSKEEFYATALFIAKERLNNRFEELPVVGAHCYGYHSDLLPGCVWGGCTAGRSSLGITSDGGIVGCLSMGSDRFVEGNVRSRKLREIWTSPEAFAYNRRFTVADLGENCSWCEHGANCRGGCGSVSLTMTGRFHNDPYCFHAIEKGQPKG